MSPGIACGTPSYEAAGSEAFPVLPCRSERGARYGFKLLAACEVPDYFVAFDVYSKKERRFLGYRERNRLLRGSSIAVVPKLARGQLKAEEVLRLLKRQLRNTGKHWSQHETEGKR